MVGNGHVFCSSVFNGCELLKPNPVYPTVCPALTHGALDFLRGTELKIGRSSILVAEAESSIPPLEAGERRGFFVLETEDVRGVIQKALSGGAVMEEGFHGFKDPYGYVWTVCKKKPVGAREKIKNTQPIGSCHITQ